MVIVAPLKTYQLHSGVLRRYSHHFADTLREENAAKLSPKAAKSGATTRYCLQLVKTQFGAIGTFQPLVSMQRPLITIATNNFFSPWINSVTHIPLASP